MENQSLYFAIGAAVLAVIYGLFLIRWIMKQPTGNAKMVEIAKAIQEGQKLILIVNTKLLPMWQSWWQLDFIFL